MSRDFPETAAVALVSCRAARGLDPDMSPLRRAFAAAGGHTEIADWDDEGVDWTRFDVALLRSAWDYTERLPEFLAWVERTAARTLLLNPPAVVRWNSDKHYLRELAAAALPVVPTTFVEAGGAGQAPQDAAAAVAAFLARHDCAELVVKPAVGAGSRDTRRHARTAVAEILAHLQPLLSAGRSMMLQPYLEGVDRDGETALIFIDGSFSHAIRKGPLLPSGSPATDALFAPEDITPRAAAGDELEIAARIVRSLPSGAPLYARVDLIRDAAGSPQLLELELIEPSLFFAHSPGSAERFAAAVIARLRSA